VVDAGAREDRRMMRIDEPAARAAGGFALWNLGFRPFYLLASLFAAFSVGLWALQYTGVLHAPYLRGAAWHGHEMLFGYTFAVIAGFLLTAVPNWTGQPTPAGLRLAGLAALWLAGRVLVLTPYGIAAAAVNAAFPLAIALAIALPLARSRNRRNYFFVALLVLAACAELAFHLSMLGVAPWDARWGLRAGLDVVLFVIAVVGGRVIPMFTNNAIAGAGAGRKPWVEKAALGSVLALAAADLAGASEAIVAAVAIVAALAHGARLHLWRWWRTRGTPLVWILHAAYAWIVIHLALRALASLGGISEALATHALTVGAIGGMTIGMMARTAKGHTGRLLQADGYEVAAFGLVLLAAVLRVFGALAWPAGYVASVAASALCWSAAFALYALRYWPVLTKPRLDGRPG
jgi:uncharacterized protein involved in response to NO